MIKLILADDHELILAALKTIIDEEPDMDILGMVSNGEEALAIMKKSRPDILITDVYMPGIGGEQLTRKVKSLFPEVKILALTIFDDEKTVESMMEAGVDGIITKNLSKVVVISAIRDTMAGLSVLKSSAYKKLVQNISSKAYKDVTIQRSTGLSSEELDILRLIGKGLSNGEISKQLYFSENTLKHKIAGIMARLNMTNRVQLAVYASKNNII